MSPSPSGGSSLFGGGGGRERGAGSPPPSPAALVLIIHTSGRLGLLLTKLRGPHEAGASGQLLSPAPPLPGRPGPLLRASFCQEPPSVPFSSCCPRGLRAPPPISLGVPGRRETEARGSQGVLGGESLCSATHLTLQCVLAPSPIMAEAAVSLEEEGPS